MMGNGQGPQGPLGREAYAIARCVTACAEARDWRGRWRVQAITQSRLAALGTSATVASMAAQAAAELGAWIRQRGDEIAREVAR